MRVCLENGIGGRERDGGGGNDSGWWWVMKVRYEDIGVFCIK